MILVDFIRDNPSDWRAKLEAKPYCVTIKDNGIYTIFNYSQIDSDFYNPLVKACRGIILKNANTDPVVVCFPFTKFGNYGEGYADKIDWSSAKVQEKVDGCLDEETQIETPEGFRTVKDLCETHYRGLVRSRNLETGEIIWDEVEADSIQDNNDDWYELELEDGRKIKLTGNHRVWLPELRCWRQVRDLEGHEKVDVI